MPYKQKDKLLNKTMKDAELLLKDSLELYLANDYKNAALKLPLAHKIFLAYKNINKVSICLSLTSLMKYLSKEENYYKSLLLLEDSKFLAESSEDKLAKAINKFAAGHIYYKEKKYNEALVYLTYADEYLNELPLLKIKTYELLALTYMKLRDKKLSCEYMDKAIKNAENYKDKFVIANLKEILKKYPDLNNQNEKNVSGTIGNEQNTSLLLALSKIARTVNAEANLDQLLFTVADQTRLLLDADRCTVFIYDKENNELWSKVATGIESEEIRFSADKGLAGYVAKTGETIKIQDAYNDNRFNKEIDKHTGYKTYNILCMPIRNIKNEIIGVFQVLNKRNGNFNEADEEMMLAIGTNAGIAIENNLLFSIQQKMLNDQQQVFAGFIDTLAASIDARDKITLGHSKRVRLYSELICNQLGLNKDITEIIAKAAVLHDIGKIGIRDDVLQKKGPLTSTEYEHIKEHVRITYDILCKTNMNSSFSEIAEIAASHHEKYDGTGYFRGLKGEEIPLGGRVLAVGDVFDAITSIRHYRDRMPIKDVLNIITEGKNKHFDGKIIDSFLSIPCGLIIEILIEEYKTKLIEKDKKLLSSINLNHFYEILTKTNRTTKENKIIEIFNSYYIRPKDKTTTQNQAI